ncbi:MAG TPA: VOC family protein [Pyrinomonadaceae bacterium]|nr:VOC family protein [Pyrinomonadaceae bacterium]
MGIGIIEVSHVNVTVPAALEQAAKHFYGEVIGLKQIPKPEGPRQFVGAWYELGNSQLHLSVEEDPQNAGSSRHICYGVADLAVAEQVLRDAGIEIIPDPLRRFFVRDPAGNLIEITERRAG